MMPKKIGWNLGFEANIKYGHELNDTEFVKDALQSIAGQYRYGSVPKGLEEAIHLPFTKEEQANYFNIVLEAAISFMEALEMYPDKDKDIELKKILAELGKKRKAIEDSEEAEVPKKVAKHGRSLGGTRSRW
ncbi:hypothetical protein PMIN04_007278 [Paraphaeosphaeria minitans]